MTIIGIPVVALAVLFMRKEDTHLPSWAWLWSNDKDGDSDEGWRTCHYPNGTHAAWWPRFQWFAIRNACFNFSMRYGGVVVKGRTYQVVDSGDPYTNNREAMIHWPSKYGQSGVLRRYVIFDDGQVAPMFYLVHQWGESKYCLRILLGYKLMGEIIVKPEWVTTPPPDWLEPAWHINPLMGFIAKPKEK